MSGRPSSPPTDATERFSLLDVEIASEKKKKKKKKKLTARSFQVVNSSFSGSKALSTMSSRMCAGRKCHSGGKEARGGRRHSSNAAAVADKAEQAEASSSSSLRRPISCSASCGSSQLSTCLIFVSGRRGENGDAATLEKRPPRGAKSLLRRRRRGDEDVDDEEADVDVGDVGNDAGETGAGELGGVVIVVVVDSCCCFSSLIE